jgi:dTMP kinase
MMRVDAPLPGTLLAVEGLDGSGKSTQIQLLHSWLREKGHPVFFSSWNSSPLVKRVTKIGKKKNLLTPSTFSLIHATDFADRLENQITPPLKHGAIVLSDRYTYTAFARDVARGVSRAWVRKVYSFAPVPALTFYFRVPLAVAISRIRTGRSTPNFHEAGMDLGLSTDVWESFRIMQERVLQQYEAMQDEFAFRVIDATRPIAEQQEEVRAIVTDVLAARHGAGA